MTESLTLYDGKRLVPGESLPIRPKQIHYLYIFIPRQCGMVRKYGKKAQKKVATVMREYKRGELMSGRSGATVKSRKQAIAIGLSEARKAGAKVPRKRRV